jgi:signal transduction histidine kinase
MQMGEASDIVRRQSDSLGALKEAEAFNFALFQYNPLPTTVVDARGHVVKSNLARRDSGEPLPGLGTPLFIDEESNGTRLQQALLDCIANDHVHHFSDVAIGSRSVAVTMAPVPSGAIVICDDITERKRAGEQLIQAQKLAATGTLVTGVAHEISNPNNALLLAGSGLERNVTPLLHTVETVGDAALLRVAGRPFCDVREEIVEQVAVIGRAGNRIRDFVMQLRDFARPRPADLKGNVDVNSAVRKSVSLIAPVIRKATEQFSTDYAHALPPVAGDEQQIEQVIVNLLTNASQALTNREQAIRVSTSREDEHVLITVQDGGAGMSAENIARIKEPFFTTKHDTGGTGLGLSISDKIIRSHGGTVAFDSTPGNGTTVTVRLPTAGRPAETRGEAK